MTGTRIRYLNPGKVLNSIHLCSFRFVMSINKAGRRKEMDWVFNTKRLFESFGKKNEQIWMRA